MVNDMLRSWVMALTLCAGTVTWAQPDPASGSSGSDTSPASALASSASAVAPAPAPRRWVSVPRLSGHLKAGDLGLLINDDDPYSTAVGAYYAQARHLLHHQILHVHLGRKPRLSAREFEVLNAQVREHFRANIQALALAWAWPFAVNCNSITGALAMGYDDHLCRDSGQESRWSPLFNAATSQPYTDFHMRPAMLIAAGSVDQAKALIDRGLASDHSLGWWGLPVVQAHFVTTSDKVRSVRSHFFPPNDIPTTFGVQLDFDHADALDHPRSVLLYITGIEHVNRLDEVQFVPGALADDLTSYGGILDKDSYGQTTTTDWIDAGATASYGTVSEPRSYPQKFPHPQLLLLHYIQGATALEAYWKSVAWPQQGLFVGEPLATPFSRQ